jgi:hypothetical protein
MVKKVTREAEVREAEVRPIESWSPPQLLPTPDERPGWVHRYVRTSTMGEADPMNISGKRREGFEPVKAEDYPELMSHASVDGQFKGSIEIGGLVLCRAPAEFMEQRSKYYSNLNQSQMESVDNNFMADNDPRMRKFSERATKVTFGKGS